MKTLLLGVAMLICYNISSQPKFKGNKEASILPALNTVVQDYFKNFEDAKGDLISESTGTVTFESHTRIPGALSCIISKYALPATYSWEAVMYDAEDFENAAKRYQQLFKELNNSKFAPNGFEKFTLKGSFDVPDESRGFAASTMKLEAPRKPWDNFTIELGIEYQFPNWIVKISMFEKVPDEDIRPGMKTLR